MKVAIDVSPITTGHSIRGIGFYTKNLIKEFKKKQVNGVTFEFFKNANSPPPASIIHYPYFDLFFHTLPLKKTASRVVTVHDVIPLVFPDKFPSGVRGKYNLFLQKQALKNADAVICDSEASKKDIAKYLNYPLDKIYVVYLGASAMFRKITDTKRLSTVSKKYNLPPNFILYVGDVNWSKNIPNLIKAIRDLDTKLVMVGKALTNNSLTEVKEIDSIIKALQLGDKVIKTGYVQDNDLVAIYNLASATILPSFYEGFGLPVLESMACGTPVVCSKRGSLAEIGDSHAIFCEPENTHDMSKKIKQAINLNESERSNFSKKLIEYTSHFTWEKTASETINVYTKVL